MDAVLQQPDAGLLARVDQTLQGLPADQLVWLSGYLYGLARQGGQRPVVPVSGGAALQVQVHVYYGSQTGNARRLAESARDGLRAAGVAAELVNLAKVRARDLTKVGHALFVVSTQGDGEPAEDARDLYAALASDGAPRLAQLHYAVLGLGDSSYPQFNAAGRWLDERLHQLGASRLQDRLEGDLDYARHAPEWLSALQRALPEPQTTAAAVPATATATATASRVATPEAPAAAELLGNQRISTRDALREVRHLEFAIDPTTLDYQPGDAFGVRFHNPPQLVEPLLDTLGCSGNESITAFGRSQSLAQWLSEDLEISRLSRPLLKALAEAAPQSPAASLLQASADTLQARLAELQPIDLLRHTPGALSPATMVQTLMPLKGRLYSIASSRKAVGDEIHLTVAHRADPRADRVAYGAASTVLASARPGAVFQSWVEPNPRFRLPADPARDVVMIGPGTGVAPFRGFLQEREAVGASGRNWLVFGNRHLRRDFLYQLEWQDALRRGSLHRLSVAFSRDGERRHYVQDRLLEHGAELYAWIAGGAHLYVCGDAAAMAPAVEAALIEVLARQGGQAPEAAQAELQALRASGRYALDVY